MINALWLIPAFMAGVIMGVILAALMAVNNRKGDE